MENIMDILFNEFMATKEEDSQEVIEATDILKSHIKKAEENILSSTDAGRILDAAIFVSFCSMKDAYIEGVKAGVQFTKELQK